MQSALLQKLQECVCDNSFRKRKIRIYRKCDKKAKTVYWEKRLRKE